MAGRAVSALTEEWIVSSAVKRWVVISVVVLAVVSALIAFSFVAYRTTTVPEVRKLPVATASEKLEASGLRLGDTSQIATGALGAGMVLQQNPGPGSKVARRSSVEVTVTVQPVVTSTPDVVGRPVSSAVAQLAAELYLPVAVDVFDADDAAGTVVGQVPAAGRRWLTGRPIGIAVSVGPDDGSGVEVPALEGSTLDQAFVELKAVGLEGSAFLVNVASPELNKVVDQFPDPGSRVTPGTRVLLLLEQP